MRESGPISTREAAEALAQTLKERAVGEITEPITVVERYEPTPSEVVVHDSKGAKRPDETRR